MSANKSFGEKMGDWFRHVLSCCDRGDEEEERPALQISGPTNFRREDISIPGLDPDQQRFIREKAICDAQKMWSNLQPLRASPPSSTPFLTSTPTDKPDNLLPSYEDFTTPRSAPSPTAPPRSTESMLKKHARKFSNSLTKPLGGYHAVPGAGDGREDSKYEMRALMDPSRTQVVAGTQTPPRGKLSGESFSMSGSEQEDRDSGKGLVRI